MSPMPVVAPADIFAAGERVRYWSVTNAQWVDTQVHKVNRGPSGNITSYDLTAKPCACTSRIRRASTPAVAPTRLEEGSDGCGATNGASAHQTEWVDLAPATAVAVAAPKRATESAHPDKVEKKARWLAKRFHTRQGSNSLSDSCGGSGEDASPRSRSRSRRRSGAKDAGAATAGAGSVAALSGSNPAIFKGFQVGDQVDYYSDSKGRWVATVVKNRIVQKDKSIMYDLSCKLAVPAKRVRFSHAAPDGRSEFYSHSSKRWLRFPGRVDTPLQRPCLVDPYL